MFHSPVLETVLAIVVVLFIFAVLVTCVQEGIATLTRARGKMLEQAINDVLHDKFNKNFAYLLYQHPQIDLLKRKQGDLPSYIDADAFSSALVDLVAAESTETVYVESPDKKKLEKQERFTEAAMQHAPQSMRMETTGDGEPMTRSVDLAQRFWMGTDSMRYSDLKKLLLSFEAGPEGRARSQSAEELKAQIKHWYNSYMDRVTGWYKRLVRRNIFVAATIVALVFNVNMISLSKTIYADSKLRSTLTTMADSLAKDPAPISHMKERLAADTIALKDVNINAIVGTELPIGWKGAAADERVRSRTGLGKAFAWIGYFFREHFTLFNILGWALTVLALSLGAPFWFDIMKKIVNVRNAGKTPAN